MTLATMLNATMHAVLCPTWITSEELVKRHSFVQTFISALNAKQALFVSILHIEVDSSYALSFFAEFK